MGLVGSKFETRGLVTVKIASLLVVLLLGCLAFWPALSAGFIGDDFQLLAQAKVVRNPLVYFSENHSLSYFYRPATMSVWWLSAHIPGEYGTTPFGQYLLQLLLHLGNAVLLFAFCLKLLQRVHSNNPVSESIAPWQILLAAAASSYFVSGAIGTGTAIWLADRFDLMASMGVLCLLILALYDRLPERQSPVFNRHFFTYAVGLFCAAFLAAFSKEISLAALPSLYLCFWLMPNQSKTFRFGLIALITAPFAVMLLARFHLIADVQSTTGLAHVITDVLRGISGWFKHSAVAFTGGAGLFAMPLIVLLLAPCLGSVWLLRRVPHLAALLGIVVLATVLQAPVTMNALMDPNATDNPANLRFYYLAQLAWLPAVVVTIDLAARALGKTSNFRVAVIAVSAVVFFCCTLNQVPSSRQMAEAWVRASAKETQIRLIDSAVAHLRTYVTQLDANTPCVVQLLDTKATVPFFAGFADITLKSALRRNERAFNCLIWTEGVPWYQLVNTTRTLPASLRLPRVEYGRPLEARTLDDLTYLFLPIDLAQRSPVQPLRLRWNGTKFVPAS